MRTKTVLLAVFLFALQGCESESARREREQLEAAALSERMRTADAALLATLRSAHGVPADLAVRYKILEKKSCPSGTTYRLCVKVQVPRGLTRDELALNVKHALATQYVQWAGTASLLGAVSVLAYVGSYIDGPYDAALGEFAPFGEWRKADNKIPLTDWRMHLEVSPSYFNERQEWAPGAVAVLRSKTGSTVFLSRRASSWVDADLIARLAIGTPVVVRGSEDFGVAGTRYEVETASPPVRRGWVHGFNLAPK